MQNLSKDKGALISLIGGVLLVAAPFLPFVLGVSMMDWAKLGGSSSWVAYIPMIIGVVLILSALAGIKALKIVAIIFALIAAGLGAKYMSDAGQLGGAGMGIYAYLVGGLLGLVGNAMGLKKTPAA